MSGISSSCTATHFGVDTISAHSFATPLGLPLLGRAGVLLMPTGQRSATLRASHGTVGERAQSTPQLPLAASPLMTDLFCLTLPVLKTPGFGRHWLRPYALPGRVSTFGVALHILHGNAPPGNPTRLLHAGRFAHLLAPLVEVTIGLPSPSDMSLETILHPQVFASRLKLLP